MSTPLRILVLEDNITVAEDIKMTLTAQGHSVPKTCRTLDEARKALAFYEFDLAIIDIQLEHEETGITLANELRNTIGIPFIFLTAQSNGEFFKAASATKPAAFLIKPFRPKELGYQVQLAYENYRSALESSSRDYIFLPTMKGLKKIKLSEVMLLEANKSSTYIFLINAKLPELFSVNLGYLAQFFNDARFYQVSRSAIINLDYIEEIEQNDVLMNNSTKRVKISERKKQDFIKSLNVVRRPK